MDTVTNALGSKSQPHLLLFLTKLKFLAYSEAVKNCKISPYEWRGFPCSDGVGTQHDYSVVVQMLANSTTGEMWDENSQSPWFNYQDPLSNKQYQVWFVHLFFLFLCNSALTLS